MKLTFYFIFFAKFTVYYFNATSDFFFFFFLGGTRMLHLIDPV